MTTFTIKIRQVIGALSPFEVALFGAAIVVGCWAAFDLATRIWS